MCLLMVITSMIMFIFIDYPGLKEPEKIENLHRKIFNALQAYVIGKLVAV